jgi:uncharacterized protein YndB with AHSA1/START domain
MNEATITRTFDAPREQVWSALTEPERLAQWFNTPPFTTPVDDVSMNVRPGGEFRARMVHPDGTEHAFFGHYREVDEPERLVQTLEDPDDPANQDVELLTYTLREVGDGRTELTYHQVGHLPEEQYPLIEQGVAGFYDRLAEHLARR